MRIGGERGIRTLGGGLNPLTSLAMMRFQPLSHLSAPVQIFKAGDASKSTHRVNREHHVGRLPAGDTGFAFLLVLISNCSGAKIKTKRKIKLQH